MIKKNKCFLGSKVFLFLILLITSSGIYSQNEISGLVTAAENDQPLLGVNVIVKNEARGTTTDLDGEYVISASPGDVLIFSFIGFATKEVIVGNSNSIDVVLQGNLEDLDEVVVIGYGTRKQSDVTGAVSSVSKETISESGVLTVDQVLQGSIAGVQMTNNTGLPGGSSSIQIRGLGSINSTNEPIFVIDGVIISSGAGATENPMASLNPADIESIDVLKDASATAIYGSQGANGVIIITTKRGKIGKQRITLDIKGGVQYLPKYIEMTNLQEYAQHLNDLYSLFGWGLNPIFADPSLLSEGTNWQKEIFTPAYMQNYNFSVSGGNENTTYLVSGNYLNQDGVAVGSGFDRLTIRTVLDTKLSSWASLGGAFNFSKTEQVTTISNWNLINSAVRQSPSVPARNLDGTYGGPEDVNDALSNPLALAELQDRGSENTGIRGNIYLTIDPFKWLTFKSEYATSIDQNLSHVFVPEYRLGARYNSQITNNRSQRNSRNWTWRNLATFKNTFSEEHDVELMLGSEVTERTYDYLMGQRYGGSNQLTDLDAGDYSTAVNAGNSSRRSYQSFFGRLTYNFNERYILTGTLRYDGSSNFSKGNKWGAFPSAAFAWKVSNESFMKSMKTISNLKLRIGYGEVGNSNITAFAYTANLANVNTIWGTGHRIENVPNPDVTWETTTSSNLGIDLGLFKNKIKLVTDFYYKKTDNLLLLLTLPSYTGTNGTGSASQPWGNVGSMENKGIELSLNTQNIRNKNFQWSSNIVFTKNKNKVLALNTESAQIDKVYQSGGNSYIVTRTMEGQSLGQFYGYETVGRINSADDIYDSEGNVKIPIPEGQEIDRDNGIWIGDLIWKDYNEDGVINEQDRKFIGSPLPDFTYGIGNTLSYKNFNLYIMLQGSYGNDVLNFLNIAIDDPRSTGNVTRRAGIEYAHLSYNDPDGDLNDPYNVYVSSGDPGMPRMSQNDVNNNSRLSSRFIENGSYLRIQNINLSYSLPDTFTSKIGIASAKIYTNIQNLYTFTKYSGFDPEVGMQADQYAGYAPSALLNGIDPGRYPAPRIYSFGISLRL